MGFLMRFQIFKLIAFGALLGCSSGTSFNGGGGTRCTLDTAPMAKPDPSNLDFVPVSLDPTVNDPNLPKGLYSYAGMSIFFVDARTNFFIRLDDSALTGSALANELERRRKEGTATANDSSAFAGSISCVRNYDYQKVAAHQWSINLVTHFDTTGGGLKLFTKNIGYQVDSNDQRLKAKVDAAETQSNNTFDDIMQSTGLQKGDYQLYLVKSLSSPDLKVYILAGAREDKTLGILQVRVRIQYKPLVDGVRQILNKQMDRSSKIYPPSQLRK